MKFPAGCACDESPSPQVMSVAVSGSFCGSVQVTVAVAVNAEEVPDAVSVHDGAAYASASTTAGLAAPL